MIIPDSMKTALTYEEFDAAYKILPEDQKKRAGTVSSMLLRTDKSDRNANQAFWDGVY